MDIIIKTIRHNKQRYNTIGDWYYDKNKNLNIRVSKLGSVYMEYLIALHELLEVIACRKTGIKEKDVTEFDIMFEEEHERGENLEIDEPGNDPRAPYNKQHQFATHYEKEFASVLDIDWQEYENKINKLEYKKGRK